MFHGANPKNINKIKDLQKRCFKSTTYVHFIKYTDFFTVSKISIHPKRDFLTVSKIYTVLCTVIRRKHCINFTVSEIFILRL